MGGVLKVIGVLALIVIALIAGLIVYGMITLGPITKEAEAYANEAISAIARNWDRDEFLNRAAPELKASLSPEAVDNVYAIYTTFGPLVKAEPAKCAVTQIVNVSSGKAIVATCVAQVKCASADVQFRLAILRPEATKTWSVAGIHVVRLVGAPASPGMSLGFGHVPARPRLLQPLPWRAHLPDVSALRPGFAKPVD